MKKVSIALSFLALIGTACNKQLDTVPTDSIDETKAYTTVADLQRGVIGVYAANSQVNKVYIATIAADEAKISDENRGQGQFVYKWQITSTDGNVTAAYRQYYTLIDRVHRIFEAADRITPTTSADIALEARLIAELKALKAIAYYESLINFMPPGYDANALGIAIVNSSCLTCAPARNKVGEVVAEIKRLLGEARADANMPTAPTDPIRLSKATIAGYQSRVAMLERNWNDAVTFSTDAITFSGKSLATGATFVQYWSDANEAETFWKFRNQVSPTLLWRDANGDVFFEPSIQLKNNFNRTADIRFSTYFSSAGTDTSIVSKYKGSSFGATINDIKIMRYAEMLLNRAEAYAELNNFSAVSGASADINTLRAARITGNVPVTYLDKTTAINEILAERTKELCYEGFRWYDLKRRGIGVSRLATDVQSLTWKDLPATDFKFTFPIPQNAVDANPNTVQNPGY